MKEQILIAFPQCLENTCLETYKEVTFWVEDPTDLTKCRVLLAKSDNCDFEVQNPNMEEVHFLAIDQCLFDDSDGKKCDMALFNEKVFVFVEIKKSKPRNRKLHRKNALSQLENTISIFQSKLDFEGSQLEANICFSSLSRTFPQKSASSLASIKRFQDKFKAKLTEGNQKTF